jgi:hypothetical protein
MVYISDLETLTVTVRIIPSAQMLGALFTGDNLGYLVFEKYHLATLDVTLVQPSHITMYQSHDPISGLLCD